MYFPPVFLPAAGKIFHTVVIIRRCLIHRVRHIHQMVVVGAIIQFIGLTGDLIINTDFRTAECAVLPFPELQAPGKAVVVKVHAGG